MVSPSEQMIHLQSQHISVMLQKICSDWMVYLLKQNQWFWQHWVQIGEELMHFAEEMLSQTYNDFVSVKFTDERECASIGDKALSTLVFGDWKVF
ncbi:MAG: hypothetical protein EZS28_044319 [Streblomastix strix]|uniref:Dynein heavy chain linker domain-containing protein n=1 Tax=Streblomastix strix TaxID=222440 RepID=A0A5J4TNW9_9EUKA|nr:MAG: hypothetical protein EZS28_044319 [Streblomastix strix]